MIGFRRWLVRRVSVLLVVGAVSLPLSATLQQGVPAPRPPDLPPVSADSLHIRYAANRDAIAVAADLAATHGQGTRRDALRAMAAPHRQFLAFDGRGRGRAVEVLGDLAEADRIAVIVPGADTTLDTFDAQASGPTGALGDAARQLHREVGRLDPDARVAVVAWLGYDAPTTPSLDLLTPTLAGKAAPDLVALLDDLQSANPAGPVALLCHSYGSVVCAAAAPHITVADIAVFGSPGLGIASATELGASRLWAGRGETDPIGAVPSTELRILGATLGFGADPTDPGFGARPFPAGDGGHSDYAARDSTSLHSLALIALGRGEEVPQECSPHRPAPTRHARHRVERAFSA